MAASTSISEDDALHFQGTSPASSPYRYSSTLGQSEVRLLRFDSSGGEALSCFLETHDLKESCPEFLALSYTWGTAIYDADFNSPDQPLERTCSIVCDGVDLKVTQNLFNACTQLRDNGPGKYVWIDAVCINQRDLEEKGRQILLMGDIYGSAEEVIVWLGMTSTYLDDFIWATNALLPKLENIASQHDRAGTYGRTIFDPVLHQILDEESFFDRFYNFCMFCGTRAWFRRAWTLQEVGRARKIRLQCGPHTLSWARATSLSRYIKIYGWDVQFRGFAKHRGLNFTYTGLEFTKRETLRQASAVDLISETSAGTARMFGAEGGLASCIALMCQFIISARPYECSNPRDKIYSILGFLDHLLPESMSSYLKPDYMLSVEAIYQGFTELVLNNVPLLSVLSYVEDPSSRKLESLPSWVPDYSVLEVPNPVWLQSDPGTFEALASHGNPGPRKIENSVLYCEGSAFDTVDRVCSLSNKDAVEGNQIKAFLELCSFLPPRLNGQHRVECLWRTLIHDTFHRQHPAPRGLEEKFPKYLVTQIVQDVVNSPDATSALGHYQGVLRKLDPANTSAALPQFDEIQRYYELASQLSTGDPSDEPGLLAKITLIDAGAEVYNSALASPSAGRKLFTTQKGFIGMGPLSTTPGDQVWFMYDALTPFVLQPRPEDANFKLVGECYLHGFMHGEVLREEHGWQERVGTVGIA